MRICPVHYLNESNGMSLAKLDQLGLSRLLSILSYATW